jgi:hypothetical protein
MKENQRQRQGKINHTGVNLYITEKQLIPSNILLVYYSMIK